MLLNAELTTYIQKEATFSTATAVFLAMEFRLLFAAKNENEFRILKKGMKKRGKKKREMGKNRKIGVVELVDYSFH